MYANVVTAMNNLLAQFILDKMRERNASARKFADDVGLGRQTINNILDPNAPPEQYPSFSTLVTLARKTNTDISLLAALAAPELARRDVGTDLLVEMIRRMSPEDRDIVDKFIRGRLLGSQGKHE